MQDIDNNMDDLFRSAVDNYTLQPGESNWDTIVSQLSNDDAIIPVEINHKNNTAVNGIFLLVLLLIPLSTAMFSFYYRSNASAKTGSAAYLYDTQPQQQVNNTTTAAKNITVKHTAYNIERAKTVVPFYSIKINTNTLVITGISHKRNDENAATIYSSINSLALPDNVKKLISNQQNTVENRQPITTHASSLQKPHLYAGVTAGLTFNEVKNQGFNKPGFDIGLLAGFRINKNTSIETGLVYSKKYYYSNGKYFSMDKIGGSMPAEMKVLSLEGSSNLYQVPLVVKYDIVHKKTSTFFASAGISSYILTREKNNYQTSMNGVQQDIKGMYKNVSAGFASSIDISAGYEHTTGKGANIRIQPYLQVPLKGIGMGSMQVLSTGIHIAYVR